MTNKNDEVILVVPTKEVFKGTELFEGSLAITDDKTQKILTNIGDNYSAMRRGDAEVDKDFKQPIPYAVISVGNKVFRYRRLEQAGETKLHGKGSIGLGGHMNAIEGAKTFTEVLRENLVRELEEETQITDFDGNVITEGLEDHLELVPVGLINNEDEVGQYHICVLYRIQLPLGYDVQVNPNEADQLDGGLITLDELKSEYNTLEAWSKITADLL